MADARTLYPRHDVNPSEKLGIDWLRQYAKAALDDVQAMPDTIFWRASKRYQELRDYALGKQSCEKYKPLLGVEDGADESWLSVDFSARPVATKFLDIAVSKVLQRKYNITATPIDALARTEMDKETAGIKAKIMLRKAAQSTGDPALMNHPAFTPEPGEPEDTDELEMKMQYSMKLNVAIEAEKGVELVNYQNDFDSVREKYVRDTAIVGVGGTKEWLDENGQVVERAIHPDNFITSFCRDKRFRDAIHMGEIIEVPLVEISKYFDQATMEQIAAKNKGRFGNPQFLGDNTVYNMGFDGHKAQVLDLEIMSDDVIVYKKRVDSRGNLHVNKDRFEKRNSKSVVNIDGQDQPKYVPRTITNIYRVKWVVGTDFCYDYGLAHNIKREPDKKLIGRTSFSYHLYAPHFDNMRAQSLVERLRPTIDDYMLTHFKLQNLKNRMTPNGFAIDMDALESVDLKGSGENMTPIQVLDLLFGTGILVYRGSTLDNTNVNRKPVEPLINQYANELTALVNELERLKQEMRDLTGLNEITDGSTPSDRMLNGVASLANTSTNNALYPLVQADKYLIEDTAKGVVQRLQIQVQKGDVEGITKGLSEGAVRYIKVTKNISLHVWGIMVQDIPNDEERQMLLQQMNLRDAQGQVDPEDLITVYNIHNIKEARQYLAYKVKKRKEEARQAEIQNQQMTFQGQAQAAQSAEEAKQKTAVMMHELKMKEIDRQMAWQYKISCENNDSKEAMKHSDHIASIGTAAMQGAAQAPAGQSIAHDGGFNFGAYDPGNPDQYLQPEPDAEGQEQAPDGDEQVPPDQSQGVAVPQNTIAQ